MKLSMKQSRVILSNAIGAEEANSLTAAEVDAKVLEITGMNTAMPRVTKLDYAPEEIQEAWATFEESITDDSLRDWNAALPDGSVVTKCELNCKA